MAKYTTVVRNICEQKAGLDESKGFNNVDTVLDDSWDKIFTTQCTFFDENYREVLCKKILKHYYMREICAETVGLWQLWMNTKLEEIMPYYNQLYSSELITFNPLYNIDLTREKQKTGAEVGTLNDTVEGTHSVSGSETGTGAKQGTMNETSSGTGAETGTSSRTENGRTDGNTSDSGTKGTTGSKTDVLDSNETHADIDTIQKSDAYSDTPQGSLSNVDENAYLTNYRKIQEGDTNSGSKNIDNTDTINYSETDTTSTSGQYAETKSGSTSDSNRVDRTESKTKSGTTGEQSTNSKTNSETGTNASVKNRRTGLNSTENYIESVVGSNGNYTYSKLLTEFRDTFLNIDMMVIGEFKQLFMGLW